MLLPERQSSIPMLAGSLFAMGLPCLWYALAKNLHIMPLNMISMIGMCTWWSAGFIAVGLSLLAIGLWRHAENPYGYFALGLLISAVGLALNLFSETFSIIFFILMLCYYALVFIWPRSTNGKQPHTGIL